MVKLRLKRFGRRNRSFYRLDAMDQRAKRNGKAIEELGWYDPEADNGAGRYEINRQRVEYWLSVGAQPTETVIDLLQKAGIEVKTKTALKKRKKLEKKLAEAQQKQSQGS